MQITKIQSNMQTFGAYLAPGTTRTVTKTITKNSPKAEQAVKENKLDRLYANTKDFIEKVSKNRKNTAIKIHFNEPTDRYYLTNKGNVNLKDVEVLNLEKTEEGRKYLDQFKKDLISPAGKRTITVIRKAAAEELAKHTK